MRVHEIEVKPLGKDLQVRLLHRSKNGKITVATHVEPDWPVQAGMPPDAEALIAKYLPAEKQR